MILQLLELAHSGTNVLFLNVRELIDSRMNHESLEPHDSSVDHRADFLRVVGNDAAQQSCVGSDERNEEKGKGKAQVVYSTYVHPQLVFGVVLLEL